MRGWLVRGRHAWLGVRESARSLDARSLDEMHAVRVVGEHACV